MEYQPKSNEKSHSFYIAFQVLKVLLVKFYKIQPTVLFFSRCFTLVFTSGEISFQTFFQDYLEERFLMQIFLFRGLLKPSSPP